jgi:hypothetical protein
MIDLDNPTLVASGVILIALLAPVLYSFWIDKWMKDTPDPRRRKF